MSWFIIPVKNMHDAKSRLGHVLSPPDRKSLALSMLDHVLKTLGESPDCTGVLVVSLDPDVHAMVRSRDMRLLASPDDRSLNAAVSAGCALLAQEGVRRAAILHADLPSLTPGDVQAIARSDGAEVVLGPCRHRTGTNAISVPLPVPFSFAFGPDSFAVHQRRVRSAGLRLRILDRPGVAQDLDRPDDLDLVDGHGNTGAQGSRLAPSQAMFLEHERAEDLASLAVKVTCRGFGRMVTYSPKVFLPLTRLCRDVCHYCTFALRPSQVAAPYMSIDEVLSIARQGEALGCTEALFTLGERPELRYQAARSALKALGHDSTIGYLRQAAEAVLAETTLLPHLNPGCMTLDEMKVLRPVAASMGLMLESGARRLCDRGGPHFGSPDKDPALRWQTIRNAGLLGVPFTTGLLVGIGETRAERIRDLLAIRDLHDEFGHIQEVIIQNFRAKPGTMMAKTPDAPMEELLWTISAARIILGDAISIQAPPNLSLGDEGLLIGAGINDFGGVSPLTADFVNPEAPWPHLDALRARTNAAQRHLGERLTIYPAYASDPGRWADPALHHPIRRLADAEGFAISERWRPGSAWPFPALTRTGVALSRGFERLLDRARRGRDLTESEIVRLFRARGAEFDQVCATADKMRAAQCGDTVTYVINRNINYTNICGFKCRFCAFSKGRTHEELRGKPYLLDTDEIVAIARATHDRGASEVCLQGGIHPDYTGDTYLEICGAVRQALPDIHIHAFSPLEIWQGAKTLGLDLETYLSRLKAAGLNTLPGTAAEILDDEVRAVLCPDKIDSGQWFEVMAAAHAVGLKATSTIMFGHVDTYTHWARHLLKLRDMQERTGVFTEFVPLPFVAEQSPIFLKRQSRSGPSAREAVLMHAVARIVLGASFRNIQTSWVKMGPDGAARCLQSGANDLGGTLMYESITRSAGGVNGSEMTPDDLARIAGRAGRQLARRTTQYQPT